MDTPHVVIIGAGFGGLNAAQRLAKVPVRITLIDRQNYHLFQPLLYQVAIAGLVPSQIAYPLRTIFRRQKNLTFQMGEVTEVNFEARYVRMNGSVIAYDYLIIAVGGQTNFFGMESVMQNGFQLKNIQSAIQTRNHLLKIMESASHEVDIEKRRAMLTFVVVGGGPTGVETAGMLAELISHVLVKDFPHLDLDEARVVLLEAGGNLIASFPDKLRKATYRLLRSKNVEIMLSTPMSDYNGQVVMLVDGRQIPARTLIWTAGVKAAEMLDSLGVERAGAGRVQIEPTLQLPQRPDIFIVGDAAFLTDENGQPLPMLSTVAIQEGKNVAQNIKRISGAAASTVSLQRPRLARHHWAQRGCCSHLGHLVQRIHCLGHLGLPAYYSAGRFSQSHSCVCQLGLGLHLL